MHAASEARALACGEDTNTATLSNIAQATAHALAQAITEAEVFCEANGGASTRACGLAESNVTAVARAQAEAFAEGFAMAETCGCSVSNYAEAFVFEEIWVEASANAYAETCASANPVFILTQISPRLTDRSHRRTNTIATLTSARSWLYVERHKEHTAPAVCAYGCSVPGHVTAFERTRRVEHALELLCMVGAPHGPLTGTCGHCTELGLVSSSR